MMVVLPHTVLAYASVPALIYLTPRKYQVEVTQEMLPRKYQEVQAKLSFKRV